MRSGERRKRRRAKAQRPDPVPGILGEVRCLKLELDTERSQAEQERETAARQLARAEQEGQTALQLQKSAHEEEVKQLQEKWVGGGCGVVRGAGAGERPSGLPSPSAPPAGSWSRGYRSQE